MDVAVLLLLPLVGGYAFSRACNVSRYLAAREEGHRLYFRSAFWGFALFVTALLIRLLLVANFELYRNLEDEFRDVIAPYLKEPEKGNPFQLTIIAVGALLIGAPLGKLLNIVFWRGPALARAIKHDDFEVLLNEAVGRTTPVALSMSSRKFYVGFITQTFDPSHDRKWITILPLVSGYRDKDNLRVVFVTNYQDIYGQIDPANAAQPLPSPLGHLAPKDFGIVLPVEDVQSANLFDLVAYKTFKTGPLSGPSSAQPKKKKRP
jgi:hypothetical protein